MIYMYFVLGALAGIIVGWCALVAGVNSFIGDRK